MAVGSLAVSWSGWALAGVRFAAWAVAGALAWTLAEYALHRVDMHGRRSRGATRREHRRHHATVEVPALTADTWAGAAIVAVAMAWWAHVGMGAGWMAAYVGYELLHRALHQGAPASGTDPTRADRTSTTAGGDALAGHRLPGSHEVRPPPDGSETTADVVAGHTPDPPGDTAIPGRTERRGDTRHGEAEGRGGGGQDGGAAPRRTPWGRYRRWALDHHLHHHHVDARRNYGVTSSLWDHAFRTRARPSPDGSRRAVARRPR